MNKYLIGTRTDVTIRDITRTFTMFDRSPLPSTGISSADFVHRSTSKKGQDYFPSVSRLNTGISTTRPTTGRPQTATSVNIGRREASYIVAVIEGRGESQPFVHV